jgi:CBS domain containing-hemolysin-like protein
VVGNAFGDNFGCVTGKFDFVALVQPDDAAENCDDDYGKYNPFRFVHAYILASNSGTIMVMEWLIQFVAICLSLLLAAVKSMRYQPNALSEFELERQVKAGDAAAITEQERRTLLPTFLALQYTKEVAISVILAVLLLSTYEPAVGALLTALYFAAAYSIAARGWLTGWVYGLQRRIEPGITKYVIKATPVFKWLAPKSGGHRQGGFQSRDELRQLIRDDNTLLAPQDKSRLLGAFDFGSLVVADAMVPADQIKTVDAKETVGPVLLDRLHKDGHNMFPVIKKDIDHVQGWLYMSDLVKPHPDLKHVKDAVRSTVHYLPATAPLQDVLAASLMTGRQLFVVVDAAGKTKGMISLADALGYLNGEPLAKAVNVSTTPEVAA